MVGLWIALGAAALLLLLAVLAYNRMVSLREQVRAAWAQIDVLLKRRHDLIPNLVETVKGYATHERETLDAVISARNAAASARTPQQAIGAESALTGALGRLFAVAEAYPDLKANQNFLELQRELSSTENAIASQRQGYNAIAAQYNTTLLSFPNNLIAGPFGFTPQPFFETQNPTEREAPAVKF